MVVAIDDLIDVNGHGRTRSLILRHMALVHVGRTTAHATVGEVVRRMMLQWSSLDEPLEELRQPRATALDGLEVLARAGTDGLDAKGSQPPPRPPVTG